jgi:hypothetical protein
MIGRMDRCASAWAEDRQHPGRSRSFMRLTGKINRDRVIDHFRRYWKGTMHETTLEGGEVVILHDTKKGGGAVALIGTTDLIVASYSDPAKNDLPVLEECLNLRAGKGVSLPVAQAAILKEIPDDAWEFAVGEPPESFRKMFTFTFMHPIRSGVMWFRGINDVEMGFRGSFVNAAEAKRFDLVIGVMKRVFTNAPVVMKDAELAAAVAKAFDSLQAETEGERFKGHVRIPSRAWTALVEKINNTPIEELLKAAALKP